MPSLNVYSLSNYTLGGAVAETGLKTASGTLTNPNVDNYNFQITNLGFKPFVIVLETYLRVGSTEVGTTNGNIFSDRMGKIGGKHSLWVTGSQTNISTDANFKTLSFDDASISFVLTTRMNFASSFKYTVYGL